MQSSCTNEKDMIKVLVLRFSEQSEVTTRVSMFLLLGPSLKALPSHRYCMLHMSDLGLCACMCVWMDVGPLTGMEAACWTNSLTNVSTFPLLLHPQKLTSLLYTERRGREERSETGEKRGWKWLDKQQTPSPSGLTLSISPLLPKGLSLRIVLWWIGLSRQTQRRPIRERRKRGRTKKTRRKTEARLGYWTGKRGSGEQEQTHGGDRIQESLTYCMLGELLSMCPWASVGELSELRE